jgi:hypothetical protein
MGAAQVNHKLSMRSTGVKSLQPAGPNRRPFPVPRRALGRALAVVGSFDLFAAAASPRPRRGRPPSSGAIPFAAGLDAVAQRDELRAYPELLREMTRGSSDRASPTAIPARDELTLTW